MTIRPRFDSHHFIPLFYPKMPFQIDGDQSYIYETFWKNGTYFLSVGLLVDWSISNKGIFFYIAPEHATWPWAIDLYDAILGSQVLHVTKKGGIALSIEHPSRMFPDYHHGEGSSLKFKSL
jgi:hypothetical protein